nr:hypothetical protein [Tanacetum cinerariifolium]
GRRLRRHAAPEHPYARRLPSRQHDDPGRDLPHRRSRRLPHGPCGPGRLDDAGGGSSGLPESTVGTDGRLQRISRLRPTRAGADRTAARTAPFALQRMAGASVGRSRVSAQLFLVWYRTVLGRSSAGAARTVVCAERGTAEAVLTPTNFLQERACPRMNRFRACHAIDPTRSRASALLQNLHHRLTTKTCRRTTHASCQPAPRVHSGPERLHHLGTVSDLLQGACQRSFAGNHRQSCHLVSDFRLAVATGLEASRLVAGAARQPQASGHSRLQRLADRRQLADLRVGRQQQPHGRSQPGLLHQPTDQRHARHGAVARKAAPTAVGGGDAGLGRRAATGLASRQPAVGLTGPGVYVRFLRPDSQKGARGRAARAGGGDLDSGAAGRGMVAVQPARPQRAAGILDHHPSALAGGSGSGHPRTSGVLQRCGAAPALRDAGFPAIHRANARAGIGRD